MSTAANVAVVRRFFDEVCNDRRLDLAGEVLTDDHRYLDPQMPWVGIGPAATADAVAVYQRALGGRWRIEEALPAGDDRVVVRWTGLGTHSGELMGIPPTGRPVEVAALSLLRVANGKIAEHRCVWDTLGLLQQLGVAAAPTATAGV